MGEEPVLDIGDGAADNFMAMAKAAMAKAGGGPVKVDFQETAGVKAAQERASQRQALKQAIADQAGYKVDVSKPVGGGGGAPMMSPRRTAQEEEILDAESAAAAAAEKAEKKAATEKAAAKTASDQAAVQALLKRAAAAAVDDVTAVDEEKIKQVPLRWTSAKLGAGVSLGSDGAVASAGALAVQLTDVWMPGGRKPLIWTVAIALDDVQPDTMIGVVGRNFFPSDWERSLATSPHAVAMRCGDGSIRHKGKGTSFILRPLTSGARLNFIIDMQTLEMTIEQVGKGVGVVLSSLTLESMPSELTIAVGFAPGKMQSVRVVGCTCEKPGMVLTGKLKKDLWDDDNIQTPLPLNMKQGSALQNALSQHDAEVAVASSMEA